MPRRAVTLAIATVLVFGLVFAGAFLPVPYVALFPGPTKNVLGKTGGKTLISIKGHRTFPASGHLNLVTVAYRGGPGFKLDLFTALRGWLDPDTAVVPDETLFPEGKSAEEVEKTTSQRMRVSQQTAILAALRQLEIPVREKISVQRVMRGYPAEGKLREGDVLVGVKGQRIQSSTRAAELISATEPGTTVRLTVKRDGQRKQLEVPTTAAKKTSGESGADAEHAVVGVVLATDYRSPLKVRIRIDEIGGPSAGMIFALGIVDKLTSGNLTGGKFVAGTGTISPSGEVGPIGGIAQKLAGARADGATVFLTPAANCAEAREAAPPGMQLVKVRTLDDAVAALRALKTGEGRVPRC